MSRDASSLPVGTIVGGEYEIERLLDQGGFGAVYVAVQKSTGKRRALKVLFAQFEPGSKARARFELEARVGSKIDSEHVVDVVAAGVDEALQCPWIAMELLAGEDLQALVKRRGPLPRAEASALLRQLGHALGAAHNAGLVHRDLKPKNVYVSPSRREGGAFVVKLLDFGIAKVMQEIELNSGATEALGSPLWMAPEQASARPEVRPPTDVWALGLLAFYLLTGERYWNATRTQGASPASLLQEILFGPLDSASDRARAAGVTAPLPEGFDAWFARCVVRDVASRFSDANEAVAALVPVLEGGSTEPATATAPAPVIEVRAAEPVAVRATPAGAMPEVTVVAPLEPTRPEGKATPPPATLATDGGPSQAPAGTSASLGVTSTLAPATSGTAELSGRVEAETNASGSRPRARRTLGVAVLGAALVAAGALSYARLSGERPAPGSTAAGAPSALRSGAPSGAAPASAGASAPVADAAPTVPSSLAVSASAATAGASASPPPEVPRIEELSLGASHSCARTADGDVYCWGRNLEGELGDGTLENRTAPTRVRGIAHVTQIAAGTHFTCARTSDGAVYCWGTNVLGQLGDGTRENRTTPTRVAGLGPVALVAVGESHACVREAAGTARCWGSNNSGTLGDGTNAEAQGSVQVLVRRPVVFLAAGMRSTCAVTIDRKLWCWGSNLTEQMAVAGTEDQRRPAEVRRLRRVALAEMGGLNTRGAHGCALLEGGELQCWGWNSSRQLGTPTPALRGEILPVPGVPAVRDVDLGGEHSCAVTTAGEAWCWGSNGRGQLGVARGAEGAGAPARVAGLSNVATIAAGGEHSCATDADGAAWCWGSNGAGQLGDGTRRDADAPQRVRWN